jgi:hypothetical protein
MVGHTNARRGFATRNRHAGNETGGTALILWTVPGFGGASAFRACRASVRDWETSSAFKARSGSLKESKQKNDSSKKAHAKKSELISSDIV